MKRFYNCIETVIPRNRWKGDGCPIDGDNCYECEFHQGGGTLGGEVYVDCTYDEFEKDNQGLAQLIREQR